MKYLLLPLAFIAALINQVWSQSIIMKTTTSLDEVEQLQLSPMDNQKLYQKELQERRPGRAPHFAYVHDVKVAPVGKGTWEYLDNEIALWRLRVNSPNAKSINLGFSKFYLPEGAKMILYTPDLEELVGPLTPADNDDHEQYWSPMIYGEELVIEVQVPYGLVDQLKLELKSVNHDFVGVGALFSSRCNLDVACSGEDGFEEIEAYRDMIQSVGMYSIEGSRSCSGALISNTNQDGKPYFFTADHCGVTENNAATVVAYWNYQNSSCRTPDSPASGQMGDGSLDDFNSGATLVAAYTPTDFTLLEFDDPIKASSNAFFSGWTRTSTLPTKGVGIHHPNVEEKRISFELDQEIFISNIQGDSADIEKGNYLTLKDWDLGITEVGSSGSPLYNEDGLIIGQLTAGFDGNEDCDFDGQFDTYGWFHKSWEGGGTPETRLKDWLDPNGTGAVSLMGMHQSATGLVSSVVMENNQNICLENIVLPTFEVMFSEIH